MHCLGAVTGGIPSPNGVGGRGGILSMFRALGVLVCEGRIQGPPRGYKEGPHCAAPTQTVPNDHVCEEDNYLVTTETAVAIIFKIILLFEHEREINEVNLNLRNFFTFFFFFFSPLSSFSPHDRSVQCDRYLVLVREIADRVAIGSFLCIEVVLCSNCPCGLAKCTNKNPICTVPSLSISPWQQASEMLLEYWCVCVVPSK